MGSVRMRRWARNSLVAVVLLAAAGYLARDALFFTFVYRGTRADWAVLALQREHGQARDAFREVRRSGAPPADVERARGQLSSTEARLRERCMALARDNPGTRAELTALYTAAGAWPETAEGKQALSSLLRLADSTDMNHWRAMLQTTSIAGRADLHALGAALRRRAEGNPGHPAAAMLLAKASVFAAPDTDTDAAAPPEFAEIADLIVARHAASPDIYSFVEQLGRGYSPPWAQPFEPHLRRILSVNQDRFVRCTTAIALALLVQGSGEDRQPEAEKLFTEFLTEFDGKAEYHASGIEAMYRANAQRQLSEIRSHGLGKAAPAIAGVDLDGRPMALSEYRGKVVLVSFWATWCYPCMKMIRHELALAARFASDEFAIVGVNSDADLEAARKAVIEHGITWRSLRNGEEGAGQISKRWNVVAYPTLYLLDRNGVVRKRWIGQPPSDELTSAIERLIAGAAPAAPGRPPATQPATGYASIDVADEVSARTGFIGRVYRSPGGAESKYCVFVPRGYDAATPTPTILFLHGSGHVGADGRRQLTGALANAIKLREKAFPFISIFPQAQEGSWQPQSADGLRAMAILEEVSRDYAVDPARVYLTGPSMGGEGTWGLAAAYPERWAAIVPICGGGDGGIASRIKNIPCWAFHGDTDRMIEPELTRKMIRALHEAGARPLYHEYPGVGHNCWDRTYASPDLYSWMLDQRRGK